jgi:hypothetical protein
MRRPWICFVIIPGILVLLAEMQSHAGESPNDSASTTSSRCSLTIQSTPESARVLVDGKLVGRTPIVVDTINPGTHILILQHPDVESWFTEPASDTLHIAESEQRILRYNLHTRFFITSSPFGAEVVSGDSVVGTTPIVIGSSSVNGRLTVRKGGYEPTVLELATSQHSVVLIPLKKVSPDDGHGESYFRESNGTELGSAGLYISGAVTLLSGVTAAYLKIKADDRYQHYLLTGNGNLLSQTHQLDTGAAVALLATQIGLGLFTYFIFSE